MLPVLVPVSVPPVLGRSGHQVPREERRQPWRRRARPETRYAQTKLANLGFTLALADKIAAMPYVPCCTVLCCAVPLVGREERRGDGGGGRALGMLMQEAARPLAHSVGAGTRKGVDLPSHWFAVLVGICALALKPGVYLPWSQRRPPSEAVAPNRVARIAIFADLFPRVLRLVVVAPILFFSYLTCGR